MDKLSQQILAALAKKNYQPLKPKGLARKLGVSTPDYADFCRRIKTLAKQGRLEFGKNQSVRPIPPHGTATGIFRKNDAGFGFVRPHAVDGAVGKEIYKSAAATG